MKNFYHVIFSIFLLFTLFNIATANNYDDYLATLAAHSRAVMDDFVRENPRGKYVIDRLTSRDYLEGHPILDESSVGSPEIRDDDWHKLVRDLENARKIAAQTPEEGDEFESAFPHTVWYKQRASVPAVDRPLGPEIAPRRTEVAEQNPLWGEHKVSGGSSEIGQWLDYALLGAGAQDVDSDDVDALGDYADAGAIAQLSRDRSFKNDSLPAYCDPPNPCPIGYDPDSLPTPCDPTTKYTMELNRELMLSKVASGECTCDTEHMNSCSATWPGTSKARSYSSMFNTVQHEHMVNPYLQGQRRKRLVAKKSVVPEHDRYHYLQGQILKKVVKKTGPYAPRMNA